jgi:hypothetical protein
MTIASVPLTSCGRIAILDASRLWALANDG